MKPPLGVIPKYLWQEQRIRDLCRALYEYSQYKIVDSMEAWAEELLQLLRENKGGRTNATL